MKKQNQKRNKKGDIAPETIMWLILLVILFSIILAVMAKHKFFGGAP